MEDIQEFKSLLPDRHPVRDFFVADVFDSLPFKDDIASMSYPIFSLSKKKDIRNLDYQNGDIHVTIKPNADGLPTIFDKDVLLYCCSLLINELNKGIIPPRTLRISSHDLLVATNRATSGEGYILLKKALDRLRGVTIKTNIKTNNREMIRAFGLIESYEIIEHSRIKDRMVRLELTLSEWIYNSILGREVLTISREYFRLGKALERRLYEIARKHCGRNSEWSINLNHLRDRTGSASNLAKFKFFIKQQINLNHLPDYTITLSDDDIVTFKRRFPAPLLEFSNIPLMKIETIAKGEKIVHQAGTGWDYNEIRRQFMQQLSNGFSPDSVDGAFIAFVKKKVSQRP